MASGCISGEPQSLPQAWQCSARAAGAGGLAPGREEGLAEGARGAGAEGGQEGCACRAQAERGASQRAKARA